MFPTAFSAKAAEGAVGALNHLLAGESWARERLQGFAGQRARLRSGLVGIDLQVSADGYFCRTEGGAAPAVTIELPADAFWRFFSDRQAVFAAAKLSGSADFAETLAFVFRNLRWDVEEDLAKFVGDILAHRLVRVGGAALAWPKQAGGRVVANVSEYLLEDSALLVTRDDFACFGDSIQALGDDLECLEKRLRRLPQPL